MSDIESFGTHEGSPVVEALDQFKQYTRQIDAVLQMGVTGVRQSCDAPGWVDVNQELAKFRAGYGNSSGLLSKYRLLNDEEYAEAIAEATEHARIANDEVASGFSTLYAQATVLYWGALEAHVEDFLVAWLLEYPDQLAIPSLEKIQVPLVQFVQMDEEERMRLVVVSLDEKSRAPFQPGVGRFDPLLSAFNLTPTVDREVRDDLYEMSKVRNVILHRASVADRRFVMDCPRLGYTVGQRMLINRGQYYRFRGAVWKYTIAIYRRMMERDKEIAPSGGDADTTSDHD